MVGGLGRSRSVATVGVTAAAVLVACGGASVAVGATAPASTTLVSVSSAGVQGNRASAGNNEAGAQLSANGRYVVFVSAASNLVPEFQAKRGWLSALAFFGGAMGFFLTERLLDTWMR